MCARAHTHRPQFFLNFRAIGLYVHAFVDCFWGKSGNAREEVRSALKTDNVESTTVISGMSFAVLAEIFTHVLFSTIKGGQLLACGDMHHVIQ